MRSTAVQRVRSAGWAVVGAAFEGGAVTFLGRFFGPRGGFFGGLFVVLGLTAPPAADRLVRGSGGAPLDGRLVLRVRTARPVGALFGDAEDGPRGALGRSVVRRLLTRMRSVRTRP